MACPVAAHHDPARLADLLVRDHPGLAAPGPTGSTLAVSLIDNGHLLPALDGFDEIAEGLHEDALCAINDVSVPSRHFLKTA